MFNYYKHVEQNRENYVSAAGYEPYETFFNNIPSLFILFKNYEKRTIDALFNKRLNTVVDYMKELSSFGGNGSEWLLKNLMMSKEVDGRNFYFEVSASDAKGIIAKGTHNRVSVNAAKFQMKADGKFDD